MFVPQVDSHAFGIARGLKYVNDGDVSEDQAAITLQSWLPKKNWYQFNMELASLGQVLDRGGDDGQLLVSALLKTNAREWIVSVCTCPLYVDQAAKYVKNVLKRDKKLWPAVVCEERVLELFANLDEKAKAGKGKKSSK